MNRDGLRAEIDRHHWDLSEWDLHSTINKCECGTQVEDFVDHLADAVNAWFEANTEVEAESVPQMFSNNGFPKVMRRRVTRWEYV